MEAIALDLSPIVNLTDEQFFKLCQHHRDYRFERTASGELLIMPPTGGETGRLNADIIFQLEAWSRQNNLGIIFDSSTCFKLPNGANRSPDASWVRREVWNALTTEQKEQFPPICPDFVLELRSRSVRGAQSPTDSLRSLQTKMREYRENGARLGWLIDRQNKQVEIYRQTGDIEVLKQPTTLSGENILPGLILAIRREAPRCTVLSQRRDESQGN